MVSFVTVINRVAAVTVGRWCSKMANGVWNTKGREERERRESFGDFGYVIAGEGAGRPGAERCVLRTHPTNYNGGLRA
jgi:hypothetical protein